MSTVWEETNSCAKQYMCALYIYILTVLLYSYGIITDIAIMHPDMEIILLMDSMELTNVI